MKVLIVCLMFIAVQADVILQNLGGGTSRLYRNEDGVGNYNFGYNEDHASGGTFRRESGSPGIISGSYGLNVADGRQRVVSYVADSAGFRANVQSNEPGVEPNEPADAVINKASGAPAAYHHAPAAHYYPPAARYYAGYHPRATSYSHRAGVGHGLGHYGYGHHVY